MNERVVKRNVSNPFAAEILRNVRFSVCRVEYDRRIGNNGSRREFSGVDCFSVVQRLERRTRLKFCLRCADKLVFLVKFASADKSRYIAGFVLQRNHRSFYCSFFVLFFSLCVRPVYDGHFKVIKSAHKGEYIKHRIYFIKVGCVCHCFRALFAYFYARQVEKERNQFRHRNVCVECHIGAARVFLLIA